MKKKGMNVVPSRFLFVFLEGCLCLSVIPALANHPLREKSVNEERTRRYERRTGQKGGGGRRDGGRRGGLTRRK